jgi:hypothetical protein
MGETLIGTHYLGSWALPSAMLGGGCAGLGRDPHDCSGNTQYFSDRGFHEDFRDGYNQPYHIWSYIAATAQPGMGTFDYAQVLGWASLGNYVHEVVESKYNVVSGGYGTSWEDYTASWAGMQIGALITNQSITPADVGDTMRYMLGPQGPGSRDGASLWRRSSVRSPTRLLPETSGLPL